MATLQERYQAALIEQGRAEPYDYPYPHRGYVVLRCLKAQHQFFFLGRGSVRYGQSRSSSRNVGEAFKAKLLAVPEQGGL